MVLQKILLVLCYWLSAILFCKLRSELGLFSMDSLGNYTIALHTANISNTSRDQPVIRSLNGSGPRRKLSQLGSVNAIDDCWRPDPQWASHRTRLAECALGFGSSAIGGMLGPIYVVTDPSDNADNPLPGTLRYGVNQPNPSWIIFARDMLIILQIELIMTSYKTLDGRGANVHIAYGPCITIRNVNNVIIHGLNIHNCRPGRSGSVRVSSHVTYMGGSDGDGITVMGATNVWIDHNSLSNCADGLIDITQASSFITVSNNHFTQHDKVMLLGHSDSFVLDLKMKVTIAYNRFGPGCVQRMPRCRFGYFHIINNDYIEWEMYAIGGSAAPVIRSEGNRFQAGSNTKQVTKRQWGPYGSRYGSMREWWEWNWKSVSDDFVDGAYFIESGEAEATLPAYRIGQGISARPATLVPYLTRDAGQLICFAGLAC